MIKRITLLIFISWSLSGCAWLHHASTTPVKPNINPNQTTAAFTRVNITGTIDVNIHTDSIHPHVIFHGDPRDISHIKWSVIRNELHIEVEKKYPQYGPLHVDISSRYLVSFVYRGNGTIIGNNLHTNSLDLYLKNNGQTMLDGQLGLHRAVFAGSGHSKVQGIKSSSMQLIVLGKAHAQLSGVANITSVTMKGHSWLSLYWVRSNLLKIRLKESVCVQLAGVVNTLDAELWDNARFNGRYLRTTRGFVQTHGQSEADIAVRFAQHTLAHDTSNIYYYNLPDMKADFMAENGSVLDMREWERPFFRESTRYNR
ncbi:MAG: DUF2807 domain-containing protein [Legionellaceae bacterium]|nr:DUF2807 domain-containing protein [Legionellaceae bacterium]